MFNLPLLNKNSLENEDMFDVEALPDMDDRSESIFLDLLQERKQLSEIKKKTELTLPKDVSTFKDAYYKKDGNTLTLYFKIDKTDLQNVAKVTYGLFSTDVNTGRYEFELVDTDDPKVKELYYYNEFAGDVVNGEVKIYKRYFFTAIVRSLVAQEILFEYEANKFTINPVFFVKLQVHSASIAEQLNKRNFPIVDVQEYEKMKAFEDKNKAEVKNNQKGSVKEDKAKELF